MKYIYLYHNNLIKIDKPFNLIKKINDNTINYIQFNFNNNIIHFPIII